jgi:hypothetical protein
MKLLLFASSRYLLQPLESLVSFHAAFRVTSVFGKAAWRGGSHGQPDNTEFRRPSAPRPSKSLYCTLYPWINAIQKTKNVRTDNGTHAWDRP